MFTLYERALFKFGATILMETNLECSFSLGPRGMDKLIHDGRSVTISNDGATLI